jgi:hypothetical protein
LKLTVHAKGHRSSGAAKFRPACPHYTVYVCVYIYNINDMPQTLVSIYVSDDDTCIYATDRKEDCVLRKMQRGLNTIETWDP